MSSRSPILAEAAGGTTAPGGFGVNTGDLSPVNGLARWFFRFPAGNALTNLDREVNPGAWKVGRLWNGRPRGKRFTGSPEAENRLLIQSVNSNN